MRRRSRIGGLGVGSGAGVGGWTGAALLSFDAVLMNGGVAGATFRAGEETMVPARDALLLLRR